MNHANYNMKPNSWSDDGGEYILSGNVNLAAGFLGIVEKDAVNKDVRFPFGEVVEAAEADEWISISYAGWYEEDEREADSDRYQAID